MNVAEMKKEVTEKIGLLTEEQLSFVYRSNQQNNLTKNESMLDMDKIFEGAVEKYRSVLQKLAP